ncbi:hypothetical protein EJ06DRAFT_521561 [Trichodelitschia bisporula]|uniref:Uncharacterized protein n=1 Tax=Trichodelitschia bisporula TaxID=703511 RepID=A0A6G1HY03_9PEZI|nr:hypothetical protein EJ06DRAFT_521561 [Trichodelitschia bisporula]
MNGNARGGLYMPILVYLRIRMWTRTLMEKVTPMEAMTLTKKMMLVEKTTLLWVGMAMMLIGSNVNRGWRGWESVVRQGYSRNEHQNPWKFYIKFPMPTFWFDFSGIPKNHLHQLLNWQPS